MGDLEQKFHDHFFSDDYELDLVDLVALRQAKYESVNDYIRRFRDTRNRCFQIHLAEKQLAGLAFNGLRYYLSVFWTREGPQPTSEFVVACPCPDGLMQDGTQEGNEAYVISHRGARSRGYKRCGRARTRESEKERVRP
jgi:hypothetical protein